MESYISIYTLNKLSIILDNYKKRILKDFYEINKLNIDYQTFENKFIERPNTNIPYNNELNPNKCHAYIFKRNIGKVQCRNNKKINNLCLKHKENQNYGLINF